MLSAHQEPQDCICLSSVICHNQEADITASLRQWWLLLFFANQYLYLNLVPEEYDIWL